MPLNNKRKSPVRGGRRTDEERKKVKCEGENDVFGVAEDGEEIAKINPQHAIRLYQEGRYWCFDAIGLATWFSTKKKPENPFNRVLFSDAQVQKLQKKLQKLKNAGVDVPEINMEGYFDHGGYNIPFVIDDEFDAEAAREISPQRAQENRTFNRLFDVYLSANVEFSRNPSVESVKNVIMNNHFLRFACGQSWYVNELERRMSLPQLFILFLDWRNLKDFLKDYNDRNPSLRCNTDDEDLFDCIKNKNSPLSNTQDHILTLAVILENFTAFGLRYFQELIEEHNFPMNDWEYPSNDFIWEFVRKSDISNYEKRKFQFILYPESRTPSSPKIGTKRRRSINGGGKKSY